MNKPKMQTDFYVECPRCKDVRKVDNKHAKHVTSPYCKKCKQKPRFV